MRKLIGMTLAMLVTTFAHAQWAVIDAANLKQNIANTVSTYAQELSSATSLLNQYKQLENEYRQLTGLGPGATSSLFSTVQSSRSNQQKYVTAVTGLYGDLNNASAVADSISNQMAASGLSQDEWIAREAARNRANQQGNGFLSDYQANVLNQVGKRYDEVQTLQGQISTTEGTHQALQLLNAQMNVLLSSINQLIEQNAVVSQRLAVRDAEEVGRETARTNDYQTNLSDYQVNRANVLKQINSIGSK